MLFYSFVASFGFAALYFETALAHSQSSATAASIDAFIFITFAISFLAPPRLFRYSQADAAPRVMAQVMSRAIMASLIALSANVAVWLVLARGDIGLIEELYAYALVAILIFHGFGGAVASHIVYLQTTQQYNSNQLVAMLILVTMILLSLILYLIAFDWAIAREPYIHLRDLTLIALILLGYGHAIYLMAHH